MSQLGFFGWNSIISTNFLPNLKTSEIIGVHTLKNDSIGQTHLLRLAIRGVNDNKKKASIVPSTKWDE